MTERAGAVIGIVTGILGVLLAVGFIFLPTATMAEKAYVCGACTAISVATATGIGAWRSLLRFSSTATCMCVAVACMAALSVSVHDDQLPDAAQGLPAGAAGAASQSPSTPASPPAAAGAPASQLVTSMQPVDASAGYTPGQQTVNGTSAAETVYDDHDASSCLDGSGDQDGSITYRLDGRFTRFQAKVALAAGAASGIDVTFTLNVNDGNKDTPKAFATVRANEPAQPITAAIPSGTYQITLEDTCSYSQTGTSHGGSVTAVWINPTLTS